MFDFPPTDPAVPPAPAPVADALPELTDAQRALLLKVRRGLAGGLTQKSFTSEILPLFPGWTGEAMLGYKPMSYPSDFARAIGHRDGFFAPRPRGRAGEDGAQRKRRAPEPDGLIFSYDADKVAALRQACADYELLELPACATKRSPLFATVNIGPLIEVGQEVTGSQHTEQCPAFTVDLYARTSVYRITAPDGQVFDVAPHHILGEHARDFAHFLGWAEDNTPFMDRVAALLGMERYLTPEQRAARRAADEDNVGTCACCTKPFKVKPEHGDRIVNHGFTRPGDGRIYGQCPGVDWPAYQVSADGCRHYHALCTQQHVMLAARLASLEAGEVTLLYRKRGTRWNPVPDEEVRPGHPLFARILESTIEGVRLDLRHMAYEMARMQQMIDTWVLRVEEIRRPPAVDHVIAGAAVMAAVGQGAAPAPRRARRV